jgi:hypothetical protein
VSTYATRLRVRLHDAPADARVALAVYERDGSLPAGVDDGTAVFREEATGDRLLTGAFGEPGQAELTLTFTGSLGDVRFSEYCRPDGPRLWLKMEIDDEGWTGGPCSAGDPGEDAGAYGTSLSPGSAREQHTVRLWVTRAQAGRRGTPVANPGTVIGLGIYSLEGERRVSHGVEVPPVVEWNGRSWTWAGTIEPPAGARALRRSLDTADGPLLVGFAARRSVVVLSADGGLVPDQSMQFNARSTSGGGPQMELLAGDSYSVSLREVRAGHVLDGALVVYRPAD